MHRKFCIMYDVKQRFMTHEKKTKIKFHVPYGNEQYFLVRVAIFSSQRLSCGKMQFFTDNLIWWFRWGLRNKMLKTATESSFKTFICPTLHLRGLTIPSQLGGCFADFHLHVRARGAAKEVQDETHGILEGISSLHSWIKTQTMIRYIWKSKQRRLMDQESD
jgi:hypothetical protein